jgi:hypothetical protein
MRHRSLSAAVLAAALALPSAAFAWGGTTEGTIATGGSLSYAPTTEAGSDLQFEIRGGYYLADAFLVGGGVGARKNDAVTTYELSALAQFHFLDAVLHDENGKPYAFSPYIGARLGFAHGKNDADSNTGILAAARVGFDVFLTENVALDFSGDFAGCTARVYPDEAKLKKTDVLFRIGLDFHF